MKNKYVLIVCELASRNCELPRNENRRVLSLSLKSYEMLENQRQCIIAYHL